MASQLAKQHLLSSTIRRRTRPRRWQAVALGLAIAVIVWFFAATSIRGEALRSGVDLPRALNAAAR